MKPPQFRVENLLSAYPDDRTVILRYVELAKKYHGECGCSMGGAFFLGATLLFSVYFFTSAHFGLGDVVRQLLIGVVVIFAASALGKLTGQGLARFRLARLYRHLALKYHLPGA